MSSFAPGSLVCQFSLSMTYMLLLQAMGKLCPWMAGCGGCLGGSSDVRGCHWLTDAHRGLRQVVYVTKHERFVIPVA